MCSNSRVYWWALQTLPDVESGHLYCRNAYFFTHTYNAIQFLLLILDEKSDGEKTTEEAGMADRGFLETIKLTVLQVSIKYYSCTKWQENIHRIY